MKKDGMMNKNACIAAVIVVTGIVLAAIEYRAERSGLELRTFAQEIKGIYLWLVMPLGLILTGNAWLKSRMEGTEQAKAPGWIRRILLVLSVLAVCVISFFRGIYYTFTSELVQEERMEDGYLKGTWSEFLSETQTGYYEEVAGIFRRPFSGWNREELVRRVREKYGEEAEYVGRQDEGWHVFRLPDHVAKGEFIYFHVSDSYAMRSNGFYQILLSEAGHFWENQQRRVTVGTGENESFYENPENEKIQGLHLAKDTGEEMKDQISEQNLYITCYPSEGDIAVCAAELTDWLQFVKDTGQYPYGEDDYADSLLSSVQIGNGSDYFRFSMRPLEEFMGEATWKEKYDNMEAKLSEAFREHQRQKEEYAEHLEKLQGEKEPEKNPGDGQEDESSTEGSAEDSQEESSFMDTYRGDYEKECEVGDGRIRYRMVVEDAALGSRFYGLLKSTDGGMSWEMSNPDPFDQQLGQGIDFTFLDEQFGFATLMHNGGDTADLYVTEDGGASYQRAVIQGYTVTLEDGYTYNPYDYPQMPYEEDGAVYVLCGQGADGDYDGGDENGLALYRSLDRGHTFSFVEIYRPGLAK